MQIPESFVWIQGGSFQMGSPESEAWRSDDETQHTVTVSGYYMSKYELTQKEYEEVMGSNPSNFKGEHLPVENVSWLDAVAYCNARSERDGLTPVYTIDGQTVSWDRSANGYRLPTEAEWEYAARAGKNENKFPWTGNLPMAEKGCFYANFKPDDGNYVKDGNLITSPVGSYSPNEFGLYDMAGNVSEWTSTAYTEAVSQNTSDLNPEYKYNAAKEDPYRMKRKVVRGGSWKDVSNFIRSDIRMWEYQNEQRSYIGFRCVRSQIGFAKAKR